MAIRAVLFDLFDTLVDLSMAGLPPVEIGGRTFPSTMGALHERVQRHREIPFDVFAKAVVAVDRELAAEHMARGRELPTLVRFEALAAHLGLGDDALPRELTETHMGLLRGQVSSVAHHPEVLSGLDALPLGVCSNFSHSETALRVLEDAGLRWHFDAIVVSDTAGWRKPRPEIFEAALAAVGVRPDEALHVGDNLKADVAGAAAAGLQTAWITRRVADPEAALSEHDGPTPDHRIADLRELLAIVGR